MMQSVEIQNVVSIRASDDYQPGNNQWDIGLTDIWTWAIGLAPFKDTFWTTKEQPGYANHGKPINKTEWHPELEAAMATLSMGIVGISDKSMLEFYIETHSKIIFQLVIRMKNWSLNQ